MGTVHGSAFLLGQILRDGRCPAGHGRGAAAAVPSCVLERPQGPTAMPLPSYPEKWDRIGPLLAPTFLQSRFHRDGTALWDWFPPSRCGYLLKARERGRFGGTSVGWGRRGWTSVLGKRGEPLRRSILGTVRGWPLSPVSPCRLALVKPLADGPVCPPFPPTKKLRMCGLGNGGGSGVCE